MGIVAKLSLKELNMYEQEYLWKYLSLDKFVSILENNGLYFTTIHNLKQNIEPDECCILDYYLKFQHDDANKLQEEISFVKRLTPEVEKIINEDKEILTVVEKMKKFYEKFEKSKNAFSSICKDAIQNIFICSFTNDIVESYALWKIYPTDLNGNQQINQGIAIRFAKEHLLNIFKQPTFVFEDGTSIRKYRVFLKKMRYESRDKIIEYAKQLKDCNNCRTFYDLIHSLKIEYYKYEKEERAVIQMFAENNNCNGGFLKISPKDLFKVGHTEIHISPFATKSLASYVEFLLKKFELDTDILIKKSDIQVATT